MKKLDERLITFKEFDEIPELRTRRFRVNYLQRDTVFRKDKIFQKKKYVKQLLNDPDTTKVKLYVGDVVVE